MPSEIFGPELLQVRATNVAIESSVNLDISPSVNAVPLPEELLQSVVQLRTEVVREGKEIFDSWRPKISRRGFLISGHNLAHYLALRHHDLRELQSSLAAYGLSTLGRSEGKVLATLDAVITALQGLSHIGVPGAGKHLRFFRGDRMLVHHSRSLFGTAPQHRNVRIMVTLPTEAADSPSFVRDLVDAGVDCIRINCAHDNPDAWAKMILYTRKAARAAARTCPVLMDIAGPKIRTGEVALPRDKARVRRDDRILLGAELPANNLIAPFAITCTMREVLHQIQPGASVWIDDGKIGAVVVERIPGGLVLSVTHVRASGEHLRPEKGINFPDSDLIVNPITAKDLQDLDFVTLNADIIGYSFVQTSDDIAQLQDEIISRGRKLNDIAIIAKIETRRAVLNLPSLIVAAAGRQPFGVMIARGDLAVEIGFERLAEIQEEILWICEAAHVPVVWATQVLERLVKKGIPSRAEITDAAMSERAECVMLNKGPFILDAVAVLDNVLMRMETHVHKKTPQLRALRSW